MSVLIPAHNAEPWLAATIESALGQTWRPIEVIVVDDGSIDDTARVAEGFAPHGVKLLRQRNRGAAAARNAALREAAGDYVQFLDADDLLAPEKIAIQVAALERHDGRKVASCAWARFTRDIGDASFRHTSDWCDQTGFEFLYASALERGTFPPVAWLTPRVLCEEVGPWDERLSVNDDGEYFARVLARSTGIVFCESAVAYYRSNIPGSYSGRFSLEGAQSEMTAWASIAATMVALEDTPRVHGAVATGYQRLQARYYGRFPAIVAEAKRLERLHGGGAYRFEGGVAFKVARALFGWHAAMRLRALKGRIAGGEEPRRAAPQ